MTDDQGPMGGFDLGAMLEQAQQMQAQLMNAQAELAGQTVEGSAGGVRVTVSGTGELVGVQLTPGAAQSGGESCAAAVGAGSAG